jgi:hypothetical protein
MIQEYSANYIIGELSQALFVLEVYQLQHLFSVFLRSSLIMFSPRNFGRRKDRSTNHHLSSTFAGPSSSIITSDAYGSASTNSFSTMKVNKQDPTSPRSMDFQPYSDWNIPSKAGCTSGLWQFVQFDTKSVPSPTPPPNPPNIIRQVLKFPKKARNQF